MTADEIRAITERQRLFFASNKTLAIEYRSAALKRLKKAISEREEKLYIALEHDLGKSKTESYMCEIGMVYEEIGYMQKNLSKLARDRRVKTPLSQFAARSYIRPAPFGNVLIMSPWNYPVNLTLTPLADAIAAGNTAAIKPSAYSPAVSAVIAEIIASAFESEYVACISGGRQENTCLLDEKFDFIFFTGSQSVGREVLRHAAENLTPAVLELGGKSPCIVTKNADVKLSARRIAFGKFLNCGQTCVAPDYVLCHRSQADEFISALKAEIKQQYGERPLDNTDYGKIISEKHFSRLCGLIDEKKVVIGGESERERLRISPTVLYPADFNDAVMKEEIFGPVLPVIVYDDNEKLINTLAACQKPLALYIFTSDNNEADEFLTRLRFGGGCVNDVVIHLATTEMGFGGVGESGMGSYHGKSGFDCFSHLKSIVNKKTFIDLGMRYQPYSEKNDRMIKRFLK